MPTTAFRVETDAGALPVHAVLLDGRPVLPDITDLKAKMHSSYISLLLPAVQAVRERARTERKLETAILKLTVPSGHSRTGTALLTGVRLVGRRQVPTTSVPCIEYSFDFQKVEWGAPRPGADDSRRFQTSFA